MRLITFHEGKLLTRDASAPATGPAAAEQSFSSGLPDLDALAPGGGFARGAVHELLTDPADGKALFIAMLLARGAATSSNGTAPILSAPAPSPLYSGERVGVRGETSDSVPLPARRVRPHPAETPPYSLPFADFTDALNLPSRREGQAAIGVSAIRPQFNSVIIWCDPAHEIYPPALAALGFPLDQLLLLRPAAPDPAGRDLIWAVSECLRCKGVGAVVAALPRLSRIAARRFQLAAERGGGVGLLLRPAGRTSAIHAAATRWLVRPCPGSPTAQRWTIQLLHGHGGRIGQSLCLEHCRETHRLHTFDPVADRQAPPKPQKLAAS